MTIKNNFEFICYINTDIKNLKLYKCKHINVIKYLQN